MNRTLPGTLLMAAALMTVPALVAAETFTESFTFDGESLRVVNLIGEITVEGSTGSSFEVEVTVQGEDATREDIGFEVKQGAEASLVVKFPVEEVQDYSYPRLNSGSRTNFTWGKHSRDDSGWSSLWSSMSGKKITVKGDGRGAEMYADIVIKVPAGKSLGIRHGVGEIAAREVDSDLDMDTHSGAISATGINGDLRMDTGSGHVLVDGAKGNVNVDTGSGKVNVTSVEGNLSIDTGSGTVTVSGCKSKVMDIDTGSGRVNVTDSVCQTLGVDTGSGSVTATNMEADDVSIDTGSGSVDLALVRMGLGSIDIDTGSGGIDLALPADASVEVDAETGSGSVSLVIDGEELTQKRRSELSFTIGDGDSRVTLETGSGSIRVTS